MPVSAAKLSEQLKTQLPPVVLVHGEEPLLVEETCDAVRSRASALGCGERLVMSVEPTFDWGRLAEAASSMSLFAAHRLIDLRLPTGRPGAKGGEALVQFCRTAPADTALLIACGRLDKNARQTGWFKAVDRTGVTVEHKAVEPAQLPAWIRSRAQRRGMVIEADAAALLAYYLEGNLLAAAQEIDKLALLCAGRRTIRYEDVESSITDSARFDVYALVDHCAAGNAVRALRSLAGLKQAGTEPALIVWALANQVRTLYCLATATDAGRPRKEAFKAFRVWYKRIPVFEAALKRYDRRGWAGLLRCVARLDRVLKGREAGDVWYALERTCMAVCGVKGAGMNESTK